MRRLLLIGLVVLTFFGCMTCYSVIANLANMSNDMMVLLSNVLWVGVPLGVFALFKYVIIKLWR